MVEDDPVRVHASTYDPCGHEGIGARLLLRGEFWRNHERATHYVSHRYINASGVPGRSCPDYALAIPWGSSPGSHVREFALETLGIKLVSEEAVGRLLHGRERGVRWPDPIYYGNNSNRNLYSLRQFAALKLPKRTHYPPMDGARTGKYWRPCACLRCRLMMRRYVREQKAAEAERVRRLKAADLLKRTRKALRYGAASNKDLRTLRKAWSRLT